MTGRLADLTLADLWMRARRYRPVVVTVALTLAALRLAPGGDLGAADAAIGDPSPVAAPRPVDTADDEGADPSPPATSASPAPAPRAVVSTPLRPVSTTPVASAPATPAPTPVAVVPPSIGADEADRPAVGDTGWASLSAGTPLAAVGVPDDALPVANRLGRLDKASFLELDGDWTSLVLTEDPEGTSRQLGDVGLRACAITTAEWSPGGEQHFEDAPRWGTDCVDGTVADGTWTFPVGSLDLDHGVALVPATGAPVDFQVAFVDPRATPAP